MRCPRCGRATIAGFPCCPHCHAPVPCGMPSARGLSRPYLFDFMVVAGGPPRPRRRWPTFVFVAAALAAIYVTQAVM